MEKINKTILVTIILSVLAVILFITIQLKGESEVPINCSYLDPIAIDLFAFLGAIFLIIEGAVRITEHKNDSLKKQFTRIIRICAGFSILALHIMQFVHK